MTRFGLVAVLVAFTAGVAMGALRQAGIPKPVPQGARGAVLSLAFTDGIGAEVRLFLRFYGADGKDMKRDACARVRMPPVARHLLGKPCRFAATIAADQIPADAATAKMLVRYDAPQVKDCDFKIESASIDWNCVPLSDHIGNWMKLGDEIVFTGILPDGKTGLRATVADSAGKAVHTSVADGASWRWRPEKPGWYEVAFDWIDAEGKGERASETLFAYDFRPEGTDPSRFFRMGEFLRDRQAIAVTPCGPVEYGDASPSFGFHMNLRRHPDYRRKQFALVKLLGMSGFLRTCSMAPNVIEKKPGVRDWRGVDEWFADAEAAGFPPSCQVVNVYGTHEWNTTASDMTYGPYKGPHMYAPKKIGPWRDFIRAMLKRYPQIDTVEIWNEPHLPGYSVFWRDSSPEQFVELLKSAYETAKAVKPSIHVMMGGIGMRYLPFYERVVALGGVEWFDSMGTHCGYDMRSFRDCETRHGAEHKPYFETEWHAVLYNCTNPNPPDEEECCRMMLKNLATLLHEGNGHVTGFGLTCGTHVPESRAFFAESGGIQQICGLFRDVPFLEPRLAALALRTATDRFRGRVRKVGTWCFGEDGAQKAAVFSSDAGDVAFVWNDNQRRPAWESGIVEAGGRVIDWEGRETSWSEASSDRVYFVEKPDVEKLSAYGAPVDRLDFEFYNFRRTERVDEAAYSSAFSAPSIAMTNGNLKCSFAISLADDALTLGFTSAKPLAEIRFALDVEGNGALDDVVEFAISPDGRIVKPRTPVLRGDIPADFSPAGETLSRSCATMREGRRIATVEIAMSDLYPFVHAPGKVLRAVAIAKAEDGSSARWGGGWDGRVKNVPAFGKLFPSGGGRVLATLDDVKRPFGKASISRTADGIAVQPLSGDAASGVSFVVKPVPGSRLLLRYRAKGNGELDTVLFARGPGGKTFKRIDAPKHRLGEGCDEVSAVFEVPPGTENVAIAIFTWRQKDAAFAIAGLDATNE